MKIEDYLNDHTIIKIGVSPPGYICSEVIVDNPAELISIIRENGCYIAEIRTWEVAQGTVLCAKSFILTSQLPSPVSF